MKTELEKSSVLSLFKEKGTLQADGCVKFAEIPEELHLLGFIPVYSPFNGFDLNGDVVVTTHCVRFKGFNNVYPIFNEVSFTQGHEYQVDENLIMNGIIQNLEAFSYYRERTYFNDANSLVFGNKTLDKIRTKMKDDSIFRVEEGKTYFIGNEQFFDLHDGPGAWHCITKYFLCLCYFHSKETGNINYVVTDPKLTIKVIACD